MSLYQKILSLLLTVSVLFFSGCNAIDNQSKQNDSLATTTYSETSITTAPTEKTEKVTSSETTTYKTTTTVTTTTTAAEINKFVLSEIPTFSDKAYIAVNNNIPYFTKEEMSSAESFEEYSKLDKYGRCGVAIACVGQDLMPTEERGSIGSVKPSGWRTVKYAGVDGKYLYNRCHLIGYQLTAENANEKNLITGTRYLNIEGMLPFENMTADYIKETNNHVLYRVTPIFDEDDLLCRGVLMEGYSIEDKGEGICFCIYAYNAQPGISIEYKTGDSSGPDFEETTTTQKKNTVAENLQSEKETEKAIGSVYILNISTKKFHRADCSAVKQMKEQNKQEFKGTRDELISQGYEPCKKCSP